MRVVVDSTDVRLLDSWQVAEAQTFFRNVWPIYVHEIARFDTDFYHLGPDGRWLPDIVEHWMAPQTPLLALASVLVATFPSVIGSTCAHRPPAGATS